MNPRLKRFLKWSGLGLAALAVASLATCGFINWQTEGRIEEEIARLRAAGEPVSFIDCAPPPVPEAENGAPLIVAALSGLSMDHEFDVCVEDLAMKRSDPARLRAMLEARREILVRLREALAKPQFRYHVNYEDGFAAQMPHVGKVLSGGRFLGLESVDALNRGDRAGAVRSVLDILRLEKTLRQEPTLVSQLIRFVLVATALEHLEKVTLDAEEEREFLRLADPAAYREGLARSYQSERAFGINAFQDLLGGRTGAMEGLGQPLPMAGWYARPYLRLDFVRYLDIMKEVVPAVRGDYLEARTRFGEVTLRLEGRMLPSVSALIIPSLEGGVRNLWTTLTRLELAKRSIRARLAGPNAPEPPTDPFTGKSCLVRKDPDGITLWSVGQDGVDDGGHKERDIVWVHKN